MWELATNTDLFVVYTVLLFTLALLAVAMLGFLVRGANAGKLVDHVFPEVQGVGRDAQSQKMLEEAIRWKSKGEYLKAGWIYLKTGMYGKAAETHGLAGDRIYAAELYLKSKDYKRAAKLYEEQGQIEDAAIAYEAGGMWAEAANLRASLGQLSQAAELFAHANRNLEAGAIFHNMGVHFKAGQLYEKAGMVEMAADVYGDIVQQRGPEQLAGRPEIVKVLIRGDRAAEAAAILEASGKAAVAVDLCLRHKDVDAALEIWNRHPQECAQQLAPRVEAQDTPLEEYAKLFSRVGVTNLAARAYQRMGSHGEAARLYDETGDYITAGQMLVQDGKLEEAAVAFERAGAFGRAAALYEESQAFAKAAEAYEQGNMTFEAAEMWRQAGDIKRALRWYQRVPPVHPRFLEAAAHFCRGMVAQNDLRLAVEKYLEVTEGLPLHEGTVEIFYDMAALLARVGRHGEAAAAFHAVVTYDVGFRDANERFRAEEEAAQASGQAVETERFQVRSGGQEAERDERIGSLFQENVMDQAAQASGPAPPQQQTVGQGASYLNSAASNDGLAYAVDQHKGEPPAQGWATPEAVAAEMQLGGPAEDPLPLAGEAVPDAAPIAIGGGVETLVGTLGHMNAPLAAAPPPIAMEAPVPSIASLPPFQGLSPQEQESFVRTCIVQPTLEGEMLLQGDGQSPGAIVVLEGALVLGAEGVQPTLRSPGWVVGAGPLFGNQAASFWSRVHQAGQVLVYSGASHQALAQSNPSLAEKVRTILVRASADLS